MISWVKWPTLGFLHETLYTEKSVELSSYNILWRQIQRSSVNCKVVKKRKIMRETNKEPSKTVLFFILQKTIGKIPSEVSHCKNKVPLGWGKQGTSTIERPRGCFLCFRDAISRLRMFLSFRESKDLSQSCWELGLWKQSTTICVKTETGVVWFDARRLESDNTKVNVKKRFIFQWILLSTSEHNWFLPPHSQRHFGACHDFYSPIL